MKEQPLSESRLHLRFDRLGRGLSDRVLLSPGDDMAMIGLGSSSRMLVATDQVVVGRHVRPDEDPHAIGRKAVLRNLSDVAAMAARPIATIAAASLSPRRSHDWAERLHAGLHETGLAFDAPLIGGDLATHVHEDSADVVTVTILAVPTLPLDRVISRSGAKVGDLLAVTGRLGGSLDPAGGGRHLDFPPRIEEAIELAGLLGPDLVAMLDVSDGVARDAGRLAVAGGLNVRINAATLPRNPGCGWEQAVGDGEDYELLFACRRQPPAMLHGLPVTVIGRFIEAPNAPGAVELEVDGSIRSIADLGWEHAGS
ncbi:MAG: thiamine-phosphate kinase [Planctomycetota bacterium]|nr:thiamine-phosphate kinase [Planctomycetota bacterium]MDA1026280.1 thiamine-phosphate kinase [Planctomycetota bacterium]